MAAPINETVPSINRWRRDFFAHCCRSNWPGNPGGIGCCFGKNISLALVSLSPMFTPPFYGKPDQRAAVAAGSIEPTREFALVNNLKASCAFAATT